jgi:hypothetical protein
MTKSSSIHNPAIYQSYKIDFMIIMNVPHRIARTLRPEQLTRRLFIRQQGSLSDIKVSKDLAVGKTTMLSDDGLITKSTCCWMGDFAIAILEVLVNGCYTLLGDLVIRGTTVLVCLLFQPNS